MWQLLLKRRRNVFLSLGLGSVHYLLTAASAGKTLKGFGGVDVKIEFRDTAGRIDRHASDTGSPPTDSTPKVKTGIMLFWAMIIVRRDEPLSDVSRAT